MKLCKNLLLTLIFLFPFGNVHGQTSNKTMRKEIIGKWKLLTIKVSLHEENITENKRIDYEIIKKSVEIENTDIIGYQFYIIFSSENIYYEEEEGKIREFTNTWKISGGKVIVEDIDADFTLKKRVLTKTTIMDDLIKITEIYIKER